MSVDVMDAETMDPETTAAGDFSGDRLLELYDRVAEAPDAVERLRRFVLDLAVRGKLVEQDPADEPASELLKRIEKEKQRMVKAGEIRRRKTSNPSMIEPPFKLPFSWSWGALGTIFQYDAGTKHDPRALNPSYWLLELEDIEKHTGRLLSRARVLDRSSKSTKSEFGQGDILYGKLRPYLNKVIVADEPGYSTTEIVAIRPYTSLCSEYCAIALRRPDFVDYVTRLGQGTKMPRLRTKDAVVAPFPLPPLAEQHRIVARVDELMALLDRLEEARTTREATRDRLTAAALTRLAAPDAATPDIHLVLDNLPALTTRPDQIKTLRETILNLAVRGKLVAQDPEDEPAQVLLERIREEKAKLGLKQSRTSVAEDELPFDVPPGWVWTSIGHMCSKTGSGSTPRGGKDVYKNSGIPFLRSQNIYDDGLRLDDVAFIDRDTHERMHSTRVLPSDLLLNITGGSIGRCCIMPVNAGEANISQHVAILRPAISGLSSYLHMLVLSPYFQTFIYAEQTGAGRGGLPKYKMDKLPVALPPLPEQRRIVARVDELMELCDRLEAGLVEAEASKQELLEAMVGEVV